MSLRKNVLANYVGQGWTALMGVAFLPFYARLVGMEEYGLVGVFAILQSWMTLLDLGLTPTLNREMARLRAGAHTGDSIRDLLRSLEVLYVALSGVMVVFIILAAPWLTQSWLRYDSVPSDVVTHSIRIMAFVLAARWLELIYRGALQGLQDLVWLNGAQIVLATARWGGAYVMLLAFPSIGMFFAWQGGVAAISVAAFAWRTYRILPQATRRATFAWSALLEVRSFAVGMFMSSLLTFLLTQADKLVISKQLSLAALGAYTLAANAANGLLQLVIPMNAAVYPRLTQHVTGKDEVQLASTFKLSCEWMAAVIVPPAMVLAFFAHPFMLSWTGNVPLADSVTPLLAPLILGTLCNGLMNIPYMLQLAHGWTGLSVKVNLVAVLIMIPAILWAVSRFGAVGAAYAWLALNAASLLVTSQLMYRRLLPQFKSDWYRTAVGQPLAAATASAALLRWLIPPPSGRGQAIMVIALAFIVVGISVVCALPAVREALGRGIRRLQHSS
jgi:O-antigen/teichoic acid export membrane protein